MKLYDLLFRRVCCLCSCNITQGAVCHACNDEIMSQVKLRKRILTVNGEAAEASYIFDYKNEYVKKLLFALKRSANKDLFEYAASLYEIAVADNYSGAVCCIPRRSISKRAYGYDHVEESCRILCKRHKSSLYYDSIVKRTGHSREQKNLTADMRIKNVKNAFKAVKKDIPKNILLIDDVITTGSSATECAKAVLEQQSDTKITFAFLVSRNAFPCE